MKILVVEDDAQLNGAISKFLRIKTYDVVSVPDGVQAIEYIDNEYFDLYIIDIKIPEIDGLDLLRYIRKIDLEAPIIIITASLDVNDFSEAFGIGCSEYIKKPFHLTELDIRINNATNSSARNMVKIREGLYYDTDREMCFYKNKPIQLRYKEKRFCTIMIKNINNIVPTERIYDYVWEGEARETYPLRQLLVELRKKLPFSLIETRMKEGFIVESEE